MAEYLTVAEYAKIKGISTAAVYKKLNGSLQPFTTVVNGKKCLLSTVLLMEEKESCQPLITVDNPSTGAAEAAIKALQEQLAEKDKQIERLQEEAAELRRAGADKDKFIQEQSSKLTLLLEQSQELQRNNQILLGYSHTAAKENKEGLVEAEEEQPEQEQKKKTGFWKKIFNKVPFIGQ